MWLLTTKGRPAQAKQVLDECWETGMRQNAWIYVDGDQTGYDFTLPDNWLMIFGDGNLSGSMQGVFKAYPDERCYGWLADDIHPQTKYWSYYLEDLAAPWRLAHAQDHYISDMKARDSYCLLTGANLGTGLCWGGELVRCVGHWAPEFVIQGGIDWFWTCIVRNSPLAIYQHNVILKHDNWRTHNRPKDKTDDWGPWVQPDIDRMRAYLKSAEFTRVREQALKGYLDYVAHGE